MKAIDQRISRATSWATMVEGSGWEVTVDFQRASVRKRFSA